MAGSAPEKLVLVTGKGGVGKSVAAAAVALRYQKEGKSVLLVELGTESFYEDFFGVGEVGYEPKPLMPGIDVALWTSATCLREYALHLLKSESLYQLFFENVVMKTFIKVAPGLTELAILGKLTSGHRRVGPPLKYDVVVLDAYASGHTTALLRAPRGMAEAVSFGPMGEQSRGILKIITDPEIMRYVVVTLPEELPYQEAVELAETIEQETKIKPEVLCNRMFVDVFKGESLEDINEDTSASRQKFVSYLKSRLGQQREILRHLKDQFGRVTEIPLMTETEPMKLVEAFAERLEK